MAEEKAFRHIVRIADTDLDGNKPLYHALTKIKGVGVMFANMVCNFSKIDKEKKVGDLDNKEVEVLTDIVQNPKKYKAPEWMLNRRKDYFSGEDKHIVVGDLKFAKENDLRRLKKIKAYRGTRHMFGLPSRGQRTKSNFRKNKGKVQGVKRKASAKKGGK
ncbi:30S ribosomal protein S13 [Candidatus Woesearchaeota archaeon]|jgi:small subunit ribosomal protein S13|nr:30S ribosomal protein S13 [Candidatus Woesearchaeota archaeon]MBT6336105.1 30S ribosomal protein S13 [Candidatus Woesearchaeota archaeon]MBT7927942.1 30S ribosomal protein S13 [Candidatus Woesearchaeota archaeon]